MLNSREGIIAIVPGFSPENVSRSFEWLTSLHKSGIAPIVVCNSQASSRLDFPAEVQKVDAGENLGFARAVNLAVAQVPDWEWVVLLNDDLAISEKSAEALHEAILAFSDDMPHILVMDPGVGRKIPTAKGVFAGVSLLDSLFERFGRTRTEDSRLSTTTMPLGMYKSFSAVAIKKSAWDLVGGLDEELVFCYEDALFTSEFSRITGKGMDVVDIGITHGHSITTKSLIDIVLPVIVYSAFKYLQKRGISRFRARALLWTALAIRLPLTLLASAGKKKHVAGVLRGSIGLLRDSPPSLPRYEG